MPGLVPGIYVGPSRGGSDTMSAARHFVGADARHKAEHDGF